MKNTFWREVCATDREFKRRKMLQLALALAGTFISAGYLLNMSGWVAAARPAQDGQSANVDATMVQYDSAGINIDAYIAKPKSTGKNPAVIVIHDAQGLNDPIRNVTRQFAAAGF